MSTFKASNQAYESWLRSRLGPDVVEADLVEKHRRMRKSPLAFLRGTCWRWAECAAQICPQAAGAPVVLAIGDAHVENFGVWRDREARLVWGINDFDESARTAYAFDLIRLAASALLAAEEGRAPAADIAAGAILAGYAQGLETPRPFILENDFDWLGELARPSDKRRLAFWAEMAAVRPAPIPPRYQAVLQAALPGEPGLVLAPRRAGMGSLGRPRFLAVGADPARPVARQAKALVPSCWERNTDVQSAGRRLIGLARGAHRSPDPWLDFHDGVLITRMAPDGRKLEFADLGRRVGRRLLTAMGWEVANIHSADVARRRMILTDLKARPQDWLEAAAKAVAEATLKDWKAFRG